MTWWKICFFKMSSPCDMISVLTREQQTGSRGRCLCAVPFGRLTHPANLMHGVIFLPLTAPLAPADANRMRKQNARLCAAEVAGERLAQAAVGWSVSPGQPWSGTPNKYTASLMDTEFPLCPFSSTSAPSRVGLRNWEIWLFENYLARVESLWPVFLKQRCDI